MLRRDSLCRPCGILVRRLSNDNWRSQMRSVHTVVRRPSHSDSYTGADPPRCVQSVVPYPAPQRVRGAGAPEPVCGDSRSRAVQDSDPVASPQCTPLGPAHALPGRPSAFPQGTDGPRGRACGPPTTASHTATYGSVCADPEMAFRCTCAQMSDVHSSIGTNLPRPAFKTTLWGASSRRYLRNRRSPLGSSSPFSSTIRLWPA